MLPSSPSRPADQFTAILRSFIQGPGLPLRAALDERLIDQIAAEEQNSFGDVYSTALVLWAFVTQAIAKDRSCQAAVSRIIAALVAAEQPACAAATGAYCKARQKLSERFLRRLTVTVGQRLEDQAPAEWRWQGRRTMLVDGSTCSAPDTAANQKAYPQPRSQKPGLGFPLIRLVVLLTLATGALIDTAYGPYRGKETGETALLRTLFERLRPGDVVVADRYFCSYWMLAELEQRGADGVFRLHHKRHYDFRRGVRLGPDDHLVLWFRPTRPDWMTEAEYAAIPEMQVVREMRKHVDTPGFRVKKLVVATTLTDAERYVKEVILELYHQRWHAELDLRSLKQSLQMDVLRCKTPAMLHKEIWAHLLAYNLVRQVMAQAAQTAGVTPRQISFQATVQTLNAFQSELLEAQGDRLRQLATVILDAVARQRVGNRPHRYEPRAVKRRPKEYDRLMKPRDEARAELLNKRAG